MPRTRLAPSPTGALHLGNARTFLVNWAMARQQGWDIVLRIEDLDGPRIKAGATQQAIDLLSWLGIDWDEGPYFQAGDLSPYHDALARLASKGEIYPCQCTRSEIEAASRSAPHGDHHDLRYPGTCRPPEKSPIDFHATDQPEIGWRLRVPTGDHVIDDLFAGRQAFDIDRVVGDFQVGTKNGIPSYQLAVVVDDSRQTIDRVVRGDDLLSSTPRQQLLYELLELGPRPHYWHLPLVVGEDGRRLAKRHGDTRLVSYQQRGVSAKRVVGLLAEWCGCGERRELAATEFAELFEIGSMPKETIVFSAADENWRLE